MLEIIVPGEPIAKKDLALPVVGSLSPHTTTRKPKRESLLPRSCTRSTGIRSLINLSLSTCSFSGPDPKATMEPAEMRARLKRLPQRGQHQSRMLIITSNLFWIAWMKSCGKTTLVVRTNAVKMYADFPRIIIQVSEA